VRGAPVPIPKRDVWSVGILAFLMLSGRLPHKGAWGPGGHDVALLRGERGGANSVREVTLFARLRVVPKPLTLFVPPLTLFAFPPSPRYDGGARMQEVL